MKEILAAILKIDVIVIQYLNQLKCIQSEVKIPKNKKRYFVIFIRSKSEKKLKCVKEFHQQRKTERDSKNK